MNHLTAVYFLASRLLWTSFGTVFLLLVEPYADLRDTELVCQPRRSVSGLAGLEMPKRLLAAHALTHRAGTIHRCLFFV